MASLRDILKSAVTVALLGSAVVAAEEDPLDELFTALRTAEGDAANAIEVKIIEEWSKSGSPAMDLLLERGREAMEREDWELAIEHLSALVDHAPEFAEGWNARATAYFHADRYGQSIADIRQTLALNPRHFGALSGLGIILEQLGQEAAALTAWRAVEELSPNRPDLDETIERLERTTRGQTL
jgi:tetratricopeptide (TPR) repeat protein